MADPQAAAPDVDAFMSRYGAAPPTPQPPQNAAAGQSPVDAFMSHYAHNALISDKPNPADVSSMSTEDIGKSLVSAGSNPLATAFGVGAVESFGKQPIGGWDEELTKALTDAGIYDDVKKGQATLLGSFYNSVVRPPLSAITNLAETAYRGLGAIQGGVGAAGAYAIGKYTRPILGEETSREAAQAFSQIVETGGGLAGSPFHFGVPTGEAASVRTPPVPSDLAAARDLGVIGGTDAEYFGNQSPEFRAETDKVLAQSPPTGALTQAAPVQDVHSVARQIAPELFNEYDALQQQHATLFDHVQELGNQRAQSDAATAAQARIDEILGKVNGVESRLTKAAAGRLADARDALDTALRTETPEMARVRQDMMATDFRMRELAPQVSEAYRQASTQIGPTEPQAIPTGQPTAQAVPITQQAAGLPTIAPTVVQRLTAAGRPQEEANALGALVQAHYEARAARFAGSKGTAQEIFDREAPQVVGEGENSPATAGVEYAQSSAPTFTKEEAAAAINKAIEANYQSRLAAVKARYMLGTPEYDAALQRARTSAEEWINQPEGREYLANDEFAKSHPDFARELRDYFSRAYEGVAEKQPFHANVNRIASVTYDQARRGKITFAPERKVISLFRTADASTFIHETGHAWLEELMTDAADAQAPAGLRADAATVRDWLGAEEGKAITRAQHEKFARGFERYMMEGVAPSRPLAKVFAQFKEWLTTIYRTASRLRSPITDDIRGVFDRMLAEKPERTVYAPERQAAPNIAERAEQSAETTPAILADKEQQTIRAEADAYAAANVPEIANELADAGLGERPNVAANPPEGAIPNGRGTSGQSLAGTAERGAVAGTVGAGRGEIAPEGAGRGGGPEQPPGGGAGAGGEREPTASSYEKFIANLNTDADAENLIRQVGQDHGDFMAAKGGVISDQEVKNTAVNLAADPNIVKERLKQNSDATGIPLAAYVKAGQVIIPQMARDVREAMIAVAKEGSTDKELAEYVKAQDRFIKMIDSFIGARGQTGRAMRAYRRVDSIDDWRYAEDLHEFFQGMTGRTPEELRAQARVGAQLTQESEIARMATQEAEAAALKRQQRKAGIISYMMNSLLSGPFTHALYAVGMRAYASHYVGGVLPVAAAMRRLAGKTVGVHLDDAAIASFAMDAGARFGLIGGRKALASGVPFFQGIEELKKYGEAGEELAKRYQYQFKKAIGALPGRLGYIYETPGRMISAIHTYSYSTFYEMYASMLAMRRARAEGLTDEAMWQRAGQIRQNLTLDETAEAHEAALDATLMKKAPFGSFTQRITAAANTNLVTKGALPFVQIQTNLLTKGLKEGDPLFMMASKDVQAQLRGDKGPYAQDIARARFALAAGVATAIYGLRATGVMTGAPPTDEKTAKEWQQLGIQPYSFNIAGGSYPIRKFLGPLGIPVILAASYYDAIQGAIHLDAERLAHVAISDAHEILLNDLWVGNLVSMFSALHDATTANSGQTALRYFENAALSYAIPWSSFQNQINHNFLFSADPYRREADTFVQRAMAKLPIASRFLHPQVDILGRPMKYVAQMTPTEQSTDPVDLTLAHVHDVGPNHYWPAAVKDEINGHKLTYDQHYEYATLAGKYAYQLLQDAVIDRRFQGMDPKNQEKFVRGRFEVARAQARAKVLAGDHAVQTALEQVEQSIISRSMAAKRAAIYGQPVAQ